MTKKQKTELKEILQFLSDQHNIAYWDLENCRKDDKKDIDDLRMAIYNLDETEKMYWKLVNLLKGKK